MIESFDKSCHFVIHGRGAWGGEAGYVNNPHDPGAATNMGITRATYSRFLGRAVTITEVRNLSEDTAKSIYLRLFWKPAGCDALPAGVDLLAFDIAVNSGIGRALALLAQTDTTTTTEDRIQALHRARMGFWRRLATWAYFGKGWTRRETAALQAAIDLLHGKL